LPAKPLSSAAFPSLLTPKPPLLCPFPSTFRIAGAVETEELLWLQQRRDREARQSLGHLTDNLSAGVEPPARAMVPATDDDPPSNRHLDEEDKEPLPLFEDF
jgi:hypothetical protein